MPPEPGDSYPPEDSFIPGLSDPASSSKLAASFLRFYYRITSRQKSAIVSLKYCGFPNCECFSTYSSTRIFPPTRYRHVQGNAS